MKRWKSRTLLATVFAFAGVAHAGHEFPFYPSFYPQEITVRALDPGAAAQQLAKGPLHAYAGSVPATAEAAKLGTVSSLGGYVVLRFEGRAATAARRAERCALARSLKGALAPDQVWHPYPVTPFHADYLDYADLAEAAKAAAARGGARLPPGARIEFVPLAALEARSALRYNGWVGPPWARQGWFHAYLLLAPAASESAHERIADAARRLMGAEYRSAEEQIALERSLLGLLQGQCERIVLGYALRREHYGVDYSQGVENVGYDALDGLASAIFPRTVKLRDFPWNGWLEAAAPKPPSSPWNPVAGGFGDAFGRLVWWALADPAFLPAPQDGGWLENRVSVSSADYGPRIPVPEDALRPEPGSGRLAVVGPGQSATARIVYRVRDSAFHDGTPMSVADLLYAYCFAATWGAGKSADAGLAQATALARERLKGVRVLRVDTETLAFGADKLSYQVPVIEVYLDARPQGEAATIAPPWSILPWHLFALFEEGARRGYLTFSAAESSRRGIPELDPVRDATLVSKLEGLARELEERAYVPPAIGRYAGAEEARARFHRLREFYAAHGHWLVTNGPYLLKNWDGQKAVLSVFRDASYPKGLGSFNPYATPLKAYATRIEPRDYGAEVRTETEWLERAGRDVRIVRGSFATKLAERLTGAGAPAAPQCRYRVIAPDARVAAAGAVRAGDDGICRLEFARRVRDGTRGSKLALAIIAGDFVANAPLKVVPWNH